MCTIEECGKTHVVASARAVHVPLGRDCVGELDRQRALLVGGVARRTIKDLSLDGDVDGVPLDGAVELLELLGGERRALGRVEHDQGGDFLGHLLLFLFLGFDFRGGFGFELAAERRGRRGPSERDGAGSTGLAVGEVEEDDGELHPDLAVSRVYGGCTYDDQKDCDAELVLDEPGVGLVRELRELELQGREVWKVGQASQGVSTVLRGLRTNEVRLHALWGEAECRRVSWS